MLAVKRKGIEAVMVIVLFLLETTVFHYFEIASVKPNLLLILTASFGFMEGKREGMYVGVLSGFLLDICFGQYIGFYILFYTLVGYANGFFQKLYYDENIKLPLLLIGSSELAYGILIYVFQFMLQSVLPGTFDYSGNALYGNPHVDCISDHFENKPETCRGRKKECKQVCLIFWNT